MSDSPTITQQYSFAVGEDGETDGGIEPAEESVETSLEAFGADVDHRERDTRLDKPKASSFGVDDRKTVTRSDGGEQGALFANTTDDQQTLTGERAASQCLFGSDEQGETPDEQHRDRDEPTTNESAASATDEDEAITTRQVATDGGRDHHPDEEPDTDDGQKRTDEHTSDHASGGAVGARVMDREADDPNLAVVVARPDEPAYARDIDALDGQSVADVNPDYAASGPVATVAYVDDLDRALDVWREASADALAQICADEGVRTYDFPVERLQEATMTDGGQDDTFDPDKGTVTEAWEGAFLSARWGYDQTNVELAQIVEVSGSGKTVLARLVTAERVSHGRNSTQLRPTAEQYGDEFRLHVRSVRGDPAFRGTYPLGSDGDIDNGPTRRESFYPFNNDPENSIRRTATNHGH